MLGNLTPQRTSFLGRSVELHALGQVLDGARLVTVVGPGGGGKTRLLREAGRLRGPRAPGGVWFCDVSAARTAPELAASVARALGLPLEGEEDAQARLLAWLGARPGEVVLLVDNLEQLDAAARARLPAWLDAAPALRLLGSSREPLSVAGEVVFELPPMSPDDAAALFVERGRPFDQRLGGGADRPSIDAVVARLDRLPLAIELAAARLDILSAEELLARLEARLEVSAPAVVAGHPRHTTLTATLEWSWDLLGDDERRLLEALSVFRGGFTLAAVSTLSPSPRNVGKRVGVRGHQVLDDRAALSLLGSLRRKSLLVVGDGAQGESRYHLYEAVRAFAGAKLAARGPATHAATEADHARVLVQLAGAWRQDIDGPREQAAIERIAAERENLLAVDDRFAASEPGLAAQALLALHPLLITRGPTDVHLPRLDRVLAALGAGDDALARRVRLARGEVRRLRGNLDGAREDFEAVLSRTDRPADESSDQPILPSPRTRGEGQGEGLGDGEHPSGAGASLARPAQLTDQGQSDGSAEDDHASELSKPPAASAAPAAPAARVSPASAAPAARVSPASAAPTSAAVTSSAPPSAAPSSAALPVPADVELAAEALRQWALLEGARGRPREALVRIRRALKLARSVGARVLEVRCLGALGATNQSLGRLRRAVSAHARALALLRRWAAPRLQGMELSNLAVATHRLGHVGDAEGLHTEALVLHRQLGHRRFEGVELLHLGYLGHELGALEKGRASYEAGLALFREVGDVALEGVALTFLGRLEVDAGTPQARGLLERALQLHRAAPHPRLEATTLTLIGHLCRDKGDLTAARELYEKALARSDAVEVGFETVLPAWLGEVLRAQGDAAGAEPRFADARRRAGRHENPAYALAVEVLADARLPAERPWAPRVRALAPTSSELRRAVRVAGVALPAPVSAALTVAKDGSWLMREDGARVELARRRAVRLVLLSLTAERVERPGAALGWEALLAAGWPGERPVTDSGLKRVYTAVWTLRTLGLEGLLLTRGDGYLLDPEARVRWG